MRANVFVIALTTWMFVEFAWKCDEQIFFGIRITHNAVAYVIVMLSIITTIDLSTYSFATNTRTFSNVCFYKTNLTWNIDVTYLIVCVNASCNWIFWSSLRLVSCHVMMLSKFINYLRIQSRLYLCVARSTCKMIAEW